MDWGQEGRDTAGGVLAAQGCSRSAGMLVVDRPSLYIPRPRAGFMSGVKLATMAKDYVYTSNGGHIADDTPAVPLSCPFSFVAGGNLILPASMSEFWGKQSSAAGPLITRLAICLPGCALGPSSRERPVHTTYR